MDDKFKQLMEYEEFGLSAAEYFNYKWLFKLSKYFSTIDRAKIDTDDFDQFPKYNEYQLSVIDTEIKKDKELVKEVNPIYIEKVDKIIDDFLSEKPPVSETRYFGNVIGVEAWKITSRSGRRNLECLEGQEEYKKRARDAIPEEEVKRIDDMVLPIFQELEKKLNDNYKNLYDDVTNDEEIPEKVYEKLLVNIGSPGFAA